MIIRDYKNSDYEAITELANKYKISLPSEGKIIVAENSKGKIVAFANIRPVIFIEPFIGENPLVGYQLWEYIKEKSIKGKIKIIRCFAEPKHFKLFRKLGFKRVFNKKIPMEINIL